MIKRVLVFGSTGGTGNQIVRQSLSLGYKVTAFVRNPDRLGISDDNLKIIKGDVLNTDDVEKAVYEHDVIISALGSKPFTNPICAVAIKSIVSAMKKPQKLIAVSAFGAGDTHKGFYAKILCFMLKAVMKDKNEMEEIILKGNLDSIIVRPTILTNGIKTSRYRIGDIEVKGFPKISRADVADFMTKSIAGNQHYDNNILTITY